MGNVIYQNENRLKQTFKATSIRFRFPSEHTINGKHYPAEMQIMHTKNDGRVAFSVFISDNEKDYKSPSQVEKEKEAKSPSLLQSVKTSVSSLLGLKDKEG